MIDWEFRRFKPLLPPKTNRDPVPAPYRRGDPITGGHLHHPGAIHDEEGVVHPRG